MSTIINVISFGGIDLTDFNYKTSRFLKENGKYEITHPLECIANDISNKLSNVEWGNNNSKIKLTNIPSYEDILSNIQSEKPFCVKCDADDNGFYEVLAEVTYGTGYIELRVSYSGEQINCYTMYEIHELDI